LGPTSSSGLLATLQRRPKLLVLAFTAAILLAVGALVIADLWWRRQHAVTAAGDRAENLAFVLSEYVRGSFTAADATIRQLAIHGRRFGGASAPGDAWDVILTSAKAAFAGGALTVTDANGRIVHSTQRLIVGQSRKDNYIFRQLSTLGRDELVIDRPFLSVAEPRRYLLPIGRPLMTADGTFDGMIVATMLPDSYREFFRTVDVGSEGIIWVFHPDGVVIFREPSTTDPINQTAQNNPILLASRRPAVNGLVAGPLQSNGPDLVSAYRKIATPPLVVAVSLNRTEILADWRHQRQVALLAFGALTLTLGGMVLILFRQIDARMKVERALAEVQRLESVRLRDANERLEAALESEQRARRETEAASYLKDEFLMTVSHELRTPLTAILGWVRMLSGENMSRDEHGRAIAAIERNARSQTRLIDDLLDVSRAINGKLRIEARPVNVADVLLGVVETFRPALGAKDIQFESAIDPDVGAIIADSDRLQQIAWNLLSNAIKFTPAGGTVSVRLRRVAAEVELTVTDNGAGIPPEFLPHVFERFRQADAGSRRRYGGMGLGLAIVRHLVELHGGTVAVESTGLGHGATFRVLLPVRAVQAASSPAVPAASIESSQVP
jgi:signal transduction histidine kinase